MHPRARRNHEGATLLQSMPQTIEATCSATGSPDVSRLQPRPRVPTNRVAETAR